MWGLIFVVALNALLILLILTLIFALNIIVSEACVFALSFVPFYNPVSMTTSFSSIRPGRGMICELPVNSRAWTLICFAACFSFTRTHSLTRLTGGNTRRITESGGSVLWLSRTSWHPVLSFPPSLSQLIHQAKTSITSIITHLQPVLLCDYTCLFQKHFFHLFLHAFLCKTMTNATV